MTAVSWPAVSAQARSDFFFVLPAALAVVFGLITLLLDFLLDERHKFWNAVPAMLGVALSAAALWMLGSGSQSRTAFDNSVVISPFFVYWGVLALGLAALLIPLSTLPQNPQTQQPGEYYALILFATAGIMLIACGNDLVVLFVAFEAVSLSLYALANVGDSDRHSREGTLRFLLAGAFCTAVVAYGFSILYGLGGSTNLPMIAARIQDISESTNGGKLLIGLALATTGGGILLRIAGVPLHFRTPYVGERAPAAVAAYISVAAKLACFALLLRLLFSIFWAQRLEWTPSLAGAAIVALTIGTIASLAQTDLKRLLAYSAIAQVGYVLLAIVGAVNRDGTFNARGLRSAGYYLLAFVVFQVGAFASVIVLRRKGADGEELGNLNGLLRGHPTTGAMLIVLILSCAGVPPTAGFIAKLAVVRVLFENQHRALAWIAVLYALPPVYPIYQIIRAMQAGKREDSERIAMSQPQMLALAAMVILTLAAGIFPGPFERFAGHSLAVLTWR
jgi:NADH-quinone oxidoreductase subunit N